MCDYSLHNVASRPADVGDKLITAKFFNSMTQGFSALGDPKVAVCLQPGTEIVFENEVEHRSLLVRVLLGSWFGKVHGRLARFRQLNLDYPQTHHDALEFADGKIMLLTNLRPGQRATVLQLPVKPQATKARSSQEHSLVLS